MKDNTQEMLRRARELMGSGQVFQPMGMEAAKAKLEQHLNGGISNARDRLRESSQCEQTVLALNDLLNETQKKAMLLVADNDRLRAELAELRKQPAAAKGSTHCAYCGCDWLDNGLNPVGCPYCKHNDDKFNPCLNSLVRQVALMMDDCEEHADGTITIDCDISQGFLRRIYDLLSALEDGGYDAIEPQPAVPEAVAKDAARYRFIRDRAVTGAVQTQLPLYRVHHWHNYEPVTEFPNLDDAIDAAILSATDAEVKK